MPQSPLHQVAVIGAGPAGLMAADVLVRSGRVKVTVYDAMPSPARKFLLAGRGGLNLTHSESIERFLKRYSAGGSRLSSTIDLLPPEVLRAWCEGLGQPTFVGSSGRVFPKAMKASGLLRSWLRDLDANGVGLKTRHRWTGWAENGALLFTTPDGDVTVAPDATVLALGGASWPRLGSDGAWVPVLQDQSIGVSPLLASNCGFKVQWSDMFRDRFQGAPLKGVSAAVDGHDEPQMRCRGDAIISSDGLEGGAIYGISAALRRAVLARENAEDDAERGGGANTTGAAHLLLDLKPDVSLERLMQQLDRPRGKQSMTTFLRKTARLSPVAIGLLHETAFNSGTKLSDLGPRALGERIKSVRVPVTGLGSISRAISTAGGVQFDDVDPDYMLNKRPGVFVAGEMLDWDAPTGGYLLQACFATGAAAGRGALNWLGD